MSDYYVPKYEPLDIARQFLFVREVPPNRGQRVGGIQYWSGGPDGLGQKYCGFGLTMVLDIAYQGACPIPRSGSCQEILKIATEKGFLTTTPAPGDIYVRVKDGIAHHIGFVTTPAVGQGHFGSISANTNDGGGSDGDGWHEHDVIALGGDVFIHIPRE